MNNGQQPEEKKARFQGPEGCQSVLLGFCPADGIFLVVLGMNLGCSTANRAVYHPP